jgi:hypothetical protein
MSFAPILHSSETRPPITPHSYLVVGAMCLAVGVPSWVLLLRGKLVSARDPNLLIPFFGIPAGVMLLVYGTGRLRASPRSDHGFRVALIALAVAVCMLGSWAGVRMGVPALQTAMRFSSMAASFLALMSFVLLTAAAVQGRKKS